MGAWQLLLSVWCIAYMAGGYGGAAITVSRITVHAYGSCMSHVFNVCGTPQTHVAREAVAPYASPGYLDARYDNAT